MTNLNIADEFYEDASTTVAKRSESIHIAYKHFLRYFRNINKIDEHNLVIGSFFTYGWMPRMLNLKGDFSETIHLLNKSRRNADRLTIKELKTIASNVNRSLVGTSKLLHFVRPDVHAIYDSVVCIYLQSRTNLAFNPTKYKFYYKYLDLIDSLANDGRFESLQKRLNIEIGYSVHKQRIIEYVMYMTAKRLKKANKTLETTP